jgi:hypothetical protein
MSAIVFKKTSLKESNNHNTINNNNNKRKINKRHHSKLINPSFQRKITILILIRTTIIQLKTKSQLLLLAKQI